MRAVKKGGKDGRGSQKTSRDGDGREESGEGLAVLLRTLAFTPIELGALEAERSRSHLVCERLVLAAGCRMDGGEDY